MRILVAEDDTALASFVKKGLEAELYTVDVSAEGEQARAMAGELDFDLVVLDLNLPRMDGVAILGFLRTRKPSMPILVSEPPGNRPAPTQVVSEVIPNSVFSSSIAPNPVGADPVALRCFIPNTKSDRFTLTSRFSGECHAFLSPSLTTCAQWNGCRGFAQICVKYNAGFAKMTWPEEPGKGTRNRLREKLFIFSGRENCGESSRPRQQCLIRIEYDLPCACWR